MKHSREQIEAFLERRAEDLAVVRGKLERKRPLITTPIWKDAEGNILTRWNGVDRYVMVAFERPLMEASAAILCRNGGEILNVGFGMGLIDEAIERCPSVTRHVIVEAHEQVLTWMKEDGWMSRPRVEVIASRWEDVNWSRFAGRFDGVFFDPFPFEGDFAPDIWRTIIRLVLKPKTGVAVLYGPYLEYEGALEFVAELGPDVRLERHPCAVDIPFHVHEWQERPLGENVVEIFALSFS